MHYPTKEKSIRYKILRKERYSNLCKLYNKSNDWHSFRVKTDLINISKLELLKFWLYYTYMNRGLFPFTIVLLCIISSISVTVFLLTTDTFITVVSTLIAIIISVVIASFLKFEFFPSMHNDIQKIL